MRPGIDIIVVNYRTSLDLQLFLVSLTEYRPTVPYSLVIVNVDPTEEDEKVAWGTYPLPFDYTQFPENVGYARAVNHAATFGDRETLAIFNADVQLVDGAITDCHYALQSHPNWGILGPRQIDHQGRITHGGFLPEERGFHQPDSDLYGDIREDAVTVSGSAYFIKRTVWNELTQCPLYHNAYPDAKGAFLPTPHYYEERWCSHHAQLHDHKIVYYGEATLIHQWHSASPRCGHADQQIPKSRQMYEEACKIHEGTVQ